MPTSISLSRALPAAPFIVRRYLESHKYDRLLYDVNVMCFVVCAMTRYETIIVSKWN